MCPMVCANQDGNTPLDMAAKHKRKHAVQLLKSHVWAVGAEMVNVGGSTASPTSHHSVTSVSTYPGRYHSSVPSHVPAGSSGRTHRRTGAVALSGTPWACVGEQLLQPTDAWVQAELRAKTKSKGEAAAASQPSPEELEERARAAERAAQQLLRELEQEERRARDRQQQKGCRGSKKKGTGGSSRRGCSRESWPVLRGQRVCLGLDDRLGP